MTTPQTPAECRAEQERVQDLLDGQVTWGRWIYEGGGEIRCIPTEPHDDDVDGQYELVAQVMAIPRGDGNLLAAAPDLATAYADLLRRHAALLEQDRWIPVEERLPEESVSVLAVLPNGSQALDYRHKYGWSQDYYGEQPTHWRPLPAPPAPASAEGGAE